MSLLASSPSSWRRWLLGAALALHALATPAAAGLFGLFDGDRAGPAPDFAQRPGENEVILYCFPSAMEINYTSPRALIFDFAKSSMDVFDKHHYKHVIGHVFVRLRAGGREVLTGQTTDGNQEEIDVVREHDYGLGYLGTAFRGALDEPAKLEAELEERYRTGEMSYMRFQVSPAAAQRMMRFYDEYVERGYHRWWGEANRPRYGEGGACASFAAAFLEVGGLMRPEYEPAWTVKLRVPRRFFGGPLFGTRVGAAQLLARNSLTSSWAGVGEEYVPCVLWDPSKMHEWNLARWRQEARDKAGAYGLEKIDRAKGIRIDARALPTPTEPIWLDPVEHPNMLGRQPGPRAAAEAPEEYARMLEAMERTRAALIEAGMIQDDSQP